MTHAPCKKVFVKKVPKEKVNIDMFEHFACYIKMKKLIGGGKTPIPAQYTGRSNSSLKLVIKRGIKKVKYKSCKDY